MAGPEDARDQVRASSALLRGLGSRSTSGWHQPRMMSPYQSSAGEALSHVQGESLKGSAAVYGGFLLPGHQQRLVAAKLEDHASQRSGQAPRPPLHFQLPSTPRTC